MNFPTMGVTRDDPGKFVLGTVPVEKDGSAHFSVPSGVPFLRAGPRQGRDRRTDDAERDERSTWPDVCMCRLPRVAKFVTTCPAAFGSTSKTVGDRAGAGRFVAFGFPDAGWTGRGEVMCQLPQSGRGGEGVRPDAGQVLRQSGWVW